MTPGLPPGEVPSPALLPYSWAIIRMETARYLNWELEPQTPCATSLCGYNPASNEGTCLWLPLVYKQSR